MLEGLTSEKKSQLFVLFRMINTTINSIRKTHEETTLIEVENSLSINDILLTLNKLKSTGMNSESIMQDVLPSLGYDIKTLPDSIMQILKGD